MLFCHDIFIILSCYTYKMLENTTYTIRKSRRAKYVSFTVYPDCSIIVTTPHRIGQSTIDKFISEKKDWIIKKVKYFKDINNDKFSLNLSRKDYLKHKDNALVKIKSRIEFYIKIYDYPFNNVCVKNQKTRWGSCSSKGTLSLNYKLIFLPNEIMDYIVVHEICHLKEMNHSKNFWLLVEKTFPNHKQIRINLKKYSLIYS